MEKKNTFMIVMIVILSLSLVGVVSYIIYDKVNNDKEKNISTTQPDQNQTNNTVNQTTSKTKEERYAEFLKNLKQQRQNNKIIQSNNYKGSSLFCTSDYSWVSISTNGELKVSTDSNSEVVDTNVLVYYVGKTGNGGCSNLVYLKEDGTVKYAWKNNGKISTKDEQFKNVVSFTSGLIDDDDPSGGRDIFYIDIDGNILK